MNEVTWLIAIPVLFQSSSVVPGNPVVGALARCLGLVSLVVLVLCRVLMLL